MFETVIARITDSWHISQASLAKRIADGTQPEITLVGTSYYEMAVANAFYLVFTFVLYQIMSRRAEGFKDSLKPFIAIYNLCCVFFAGYVVYGLALEFYKDPNVLKFVCNDGTRAGEIGERLGWIYWVWDQHAAIVAIVWHATAIAPTCFAQLRIFFA